MNIKLTVKNLAGDELQSCIFHEQETLDAFIALIAEQATFGKPERTEVLQDDSVVSHPAEYTIELVDITAELEQQKINTEARAYLAATDYMVIRALENPSKPVPEEVTVKRQQARDSII